MKAYRRVPDFLIVGAARSGSTSLSNYLAKHPQVAVVSNRLEFFGEYENPAFTGMTLSEYLMLFEGYGDDVAVGEKSVSYLYSENAPYDIAKIAPDAKIFIVLRDPVERAYSDYWQRRRTGVESLSFQEAIEVEEERIKKGARFELHYVNYGFYSDNVARYLEVFGRDNVHIFLFDKLKSAPDDVCRKCFEALEVDCGFEPVKFEVHNPGGRGRDSWWLDCLFWMARAPGIVSLVRRLVPRKVRSQVTNWMSEISLQEEYPEMEVQVAESLRRVYRQEIERLEGIIDRDLSHWCGGSVE